MRHLGVAAYGWRAGVNQHQNSMEITVIGEGFRHVAAVAVKNE
jgi:hypothetical protein